MARITIKQLQQRIAELESEVERLRTPALPIPTPATPVYTAHQRPAHFEAARRAAMRMGRCVKVEA